MVYVRFLFFSNSFVFLAFCWLIFVLNLIDFLLWLTHFEFFCSADLCQDEDETPVSVQKVKFSLLLYSSAAEEEAMETMAWRKKRIKSNHFGSLALSLLFRNKA